MRYIVNRTMLRVWTSFTLLHVILWPLSWLFWAVISVRKFLYSSQQKAHRIPVILVGNLSVGGNGKTTYVIEQVCDLLKRGYRVGVITKGYARRYPRSTILVNHAMPARIIGDEAALIWAKTHTLVCVSPDRNKACDILAQAGCDVAVCDDGLQDYRFYRDIEVSLCSKSSLGNRMLLPLGPLREPLSRAELCDYQVFQQQLPSLNHCVMSYQIDAISHLTTDEVYTPSTWPYTKTVASFCAIGAPERFALLLNSAGFTVHATDLPDHALLSCSDFKQATSSHIFITEKDAVKFDMHSESHTSSVWVVSIHAHFSQPVFDEVHQKLLCLIPQTTT